MIQLTRVRSKRSITSGLRGQELIDKQAQVMEGFVDGSIESKGSKFFKSEYWKSAKKQLRKESNGKCAYCDAHTTSVAYGDVEHYRPKSIYWWLAYCYENYLYSCQLCNQKYKSNHFPVYGAAWPAPQATLSKVGNSNQLNNLIKASIPEPLNDLHTMKIKKYYKISTSEKAGIVNPYEVDPRKIFAWQVDEVLREVSAIPINQSKRVREVFEDSEKYLGINREELKGLRWEVYEKMSGFKSIYDQSEPNSHIENLALEGLGIFRNASEAFAGMASYFLDRWGIP